MVIVQLLLVPPPVHVFSDHMILVAPVATSAPLGSNASFYCAVTQAEISWSLNGRKIPLDDEDTWRMALNDGLFRGEIFSNSTLNASVLIVAATKENNMTFSIACSAIGKISHSPINSAEVYLTVFGKLCVHDVL